MKRTTVKIPEDLDAQMRSEAARRGVTISELTREALASYLNADRRFSLAGSIHGDGTAGSETVDETLAGIFEQRDRERRGAKP